MKLTPPEIYEIMRDQLSMVRNTRETDVLDPVQFYGFDPQEVAEIHFDKQGDKSANAHPNPAGSPAAAAHVHAMTAFRPASRRTMIKYRPSLTILRPNTPAIANTG